MSKLRPYLSSAKHFGVANTFYMYSLRQKRKKQNPTGKSPAIVPKEDQNMAAQIVLEYLVEYSKKYKAVPDVIYFDDENVYRGDFGIDTFRSGNYLSDVIYVRKATLDELKLQAVDYSYSDIYGIILKIVENDKRILHIPVVMELNELVGYEKIEPIELKNSTTDKMDLEAFLTRQSNEKIQLQNHLERIGRAANVTAISAGVEDRFPIYHINYQLTSRPKISILIPNKDHIDLLDRCIQSIVLKSSYSNYEIIVIENNSEEKATFEFYERLKKTEDANIRVVAVESDWNYSRINNLGVKEATGDYLLFLNNDTKVLSSDWMEQMLSYCQWEETGAVGARLFFPDGTIQHAGVTIGIRGVAGHAFIGSANDDKGYLNRIATVQNLSAVTAACMMVKKSVFDEIGGFDEKFAVAFNDTDLCMRIKKAGYEVIYNPAATLLHYESKSRGSDEVSQEKLDRFNAESMRFQKRYRKEILNGDPYYNPNLSLECDDFSVKYE